MRRLATHYPHSGIRSSYQRKFFTANLLVEIHFIACVPVALDQSSVLPEHLHNLGEYNPVQDDRRDFTQLCPV